jgi:hypothetical protein
MVVATVVEMVVEVVGLHIFLLSHLPQNSQYLVKGEVLG